MNRYKDLIIQVKKFPESQEVMDKKEWRPIWTVVGDSAYARVLDDSEYILVEKTTADEFNVMEELENLTIKPDFISGRDPGDEDGFNYPYTCPSFVPDDKDSEDFISDRDPGDENE